MGTETKFSERLREVMAKRGLKQRDLVKMTGISKSTISFYCSGKRHATDYNMFLIATALKVNLGWLMGYSDVENIEDVVPKNPSEYLLSLLLQLNDEESKKIEELIHVLFNKW